MKKFYLILTCAALCACGGGNAKQPVADVETTKDTMQVTKGVSKPGESRYLMSTRNIQKKRSICKTSVMWNMYPSKRLNQCYGEDAMYIT